MNRFIVFSLALGVASLGGCSKNSPTEVGQLPVVSRTSQVGADASCPNGSTVLETGVDDDGDGALSDSEVDARAPLCLTAPGQVSRATPLTFTSAECLGVGGTKVEIGLDNGDGGGAARDGVLQDGEVDVGQSFCNGIPFTVSNDTPPAGAPGSATINADGGNASAGNGGDSGVIYLQQSTGRGQNLRLFTTGAVDAAIVVPAITPSLGARPLEVSADTTIYFIQSPVGPTNGLPASGLVALADSGLVYQYNGTLPLAGSPYTGVHVAAGKKLSLVSGAGGASLRVEGDIINDGTITPDVGTAQLSIACARYVSSANAQIRVRSSPVSVYATDLLLNAGAIDTSGDPDEPAVQATSGGRITLESATLVNTGTLSSVGGAASEVGQQGGAGGLIEVLAGGDFSNSGTIRSDAGSSANSTSQPAGQITVSSSFGSVRQSASGVISARGGVTAACTGTCSAGGQVSVYSSGGDMILAGQILSHGGPGGNGGNISLSSNYYNSDGRKLGNLTLGATIDSHGGSSDVAGNGGEIRISANGAGTDPRSLTLLGSASIHANGGSGSVRGGNAQRIDLLTTAGRSSGAGIVNHVPLASNGGAGGSGEGGYADGISIAMSLAEGEQFFGARQVINFGTLTARGGASASGGGGSGGLIRLYAVDSVHNHAAVDAGGGAGAAIGGFGSNVFFTSEGAAVTNDAAVSANGGASSASAGRGASAGAVVLEGSPVSCSGVLSVRGGDGPGDGVSGNGGLIAFHERNGLPVVTQGLSTNVQPGTAGVVGAVGLVTTQSGAGGTSLGWGWD